MEFEANTSPASAAASAPSTTTTTTVPHIAIFPFLSKGHTIPLVHLAILLHRRRLAAVTFFTTPLNAPFLRRSLGAADVASVVELPFPADQFPLGVESTDQLPSMSLFLPFVAALKHLRPHFDRALQEASPTPFDLLISDGFFGWTNESAAKLSIPRLVFYGMSSFPMTISAVLFRCRPHARVRSPYEPFPVPGFPRLQFTKADLDPPFDDPDSKGALYDFVLEQSLHTRASQGIVVNSFYELEAAYLEHWNREIGPKAWCVGPLCLAGNPPPDERTDRSGWLVQWLDARSDANRPVLYVAFGSQVELSAAQLEELAVGLERTGLDFLWVFREKNSPLPEGFEERVVDRGLVVREWVDQPAILRHAAVGGFVSHCGWNSVMESVSAGVPILAWPMMAEQRCNAKLVVEELEMGLRVRASDGTRDGLVSAQDVERLVKELLVGEKGKEAKRKAGDLAAAAAAAASVDGDRGGSSWIALKSMIEQVCSRKT